jgi:periplasmic copper chaperone A
MKHTHLVLAVSLVCALPVLARAQSATVAPAAATTSANVTATDPWIRGTVAGQRATGMFVTLVSSQDSQLVAAESNVAGVVEVHEMAMQGSTMTMRKVPSIALPAGKAVKLEPRGLHVMLMDLKQPLKDGDKVPVVLVLEGADGKRERMTVQAVVRPLAAGAGAGDGHHHHGSGMKH